MDVDEREAQIVRPTTCPFCGAVTEGFSKIPTMYGSEPPEYEFACGTECTDVAGYHGTSGPRIKWRTKSFGRHCSLSRRLHQAQHVNTLDNLRERYRRKQEWFARQEEFVRQIKAKELRKVKAVFRSKYGWGHKWYTFLAPAETEVGDLLVVPTRPTRTGTRARVLVKELGSSYQGRTVVALELVKQDKES